MTDVEIVESLKYGFKLFGYLIGVVVLGGGGLVLGVALAGPELIDGAVTDNLSSPELLGGLVLATLGLTVWITGSFGLTYKLIADAVQWGVTTGSPSVPADASVRTEQKTDKTARVRTQPTGPSPGEQTARQFGPESIVPSAAGVSDRGNTQPAQAQTGPDTARASEQESAETSQKQKPQDEPEPEQGRTAEGEPAATAGSANQVPTGETDTAPVESDNGERTAEQIAFGTSGDDEKPQAESVDAPDSTDGPNTGDSVSEGQSAEGSIPPYEAMDERSDDVTRDEPRKESSTGGFDETPEPADSETETGSSNELGESDSTSRVDDPLFSASGSNSAEDRLQPPDEDGEGNESTGVGDDVKNADESVESASDPLSDSRDNDS